MPRTPLLLTRTLMLMLVLAAVAVDARIPNIRTASPHTFGEEVEEKTGAPVRFV